MKRLLSLPEPRAKLASPLRLADVPENGEADLSADDLTASAETEDHQPNHRTNLSDGVLRLLLPGPGTAGFDLVSPRCLQLWLALAHHAAEHGDWCCPDHLPDDERYAELECIRASGLAATWTVEMAADVCGVDARTIHRLMTELRDIGWLRLSRKRDGDGHYSGIEFVLQIPPAKLTSTAEHRYRHQLAKRQVKINEAKARIDKAVGVRSPEADE